LKSLVCRTTRRTEGLRGLFVCAAALILSLVTPALHAQSSVPQSVPEFDATRLTQPADLGETWLIHAEDDPAYSRPEFDDSHWTRFDPHTSLKTVFLESHPEIVWYRLRIKVNPNQTGLALREYLISRAFEIYVNGQLLMQSGQVAPYLPYTTSARLLKPIPGSLPATGSLVIAMRVHISPMEWSDGSDPGFFAANLTLGQQDTLAQQNWLAVIGENALLWLDWSFEIGLGLVALVLFTAQRGQSDYRWIAALGALRLLESPEPFLVSFFNIPLYWEFLTYLLRVASPYIWLSLFFAFVHQRIGWRWRAFLVFAGLTNVLAAMQGVFFSLPVVLRFLINLPFVLLLAVVIPIVLAVHLRRGNREAGILLIPALLFSLFIYALFGFNILYQFPAFSAVAQRGLILISQYPAGPFTISLSNISDILSTLSLAIIILLRSSSMSRRQALLESELAAAQQVQQLLLPEKIDAVPGFTVESVYQPAQQVGGDFFQILPTKDNGLLVIVGDVAGKGLPAAMLVSLIIGAIRTAADNTHDPDLLLRRLNERLIGRSGSGFSTALAAHITADGQVRIANAGHLSPYLDGREMELPGALPLGIAGGASYETTRFHFTTGSRLTFYSDGVIEAQNAKGELFGFERGGEISTRPAGEIAEIARRFGQSDDITVIAIVRARAAANAA
jgi:sigma-B regulation protein RsbU (phosphoserine phosphatase)